MRRAAWLAALTLALVGCGKDDSEEAQPSSRTPAETITITETDFALDPGSVSLDEPGTYAFEVVNDGQVAHALEIEGEGVERKTETLEPGERATLTLALEAGKYELYCPVADHADRGMTGKLEVTGSSDRSDDGY